MRNHVLTDAHEGMAKRIAEAIRADDINQYNEVMTQAQPMMDELSRGALFAFRDLVHRWAKGASE